jgi:hypothetical protein
MFESKCHSGTLEKGSMKKSMQSFGVKFNPFIGLSPAEVTENKFENQEPLTTTNFLT